MAIDRHLNLRANRRRHAEVDDLLDRPGRDRNDLPTEQVEDVIWGCVTPVGEQGADIARAAILYAGWDERTPGVQINRFCASGLEACNMANPQDRSLLTEAEWREQFARAVVQGMASAFAQ